MGGFNSIQESGKLLSILDEGIELSNNTEEIDFQGAGVVADAIGNDIDVAISGGVTDHGALSGLLDDDHTQYALLLGRTGGQTIIGGISSGDNLILQSTSNATKGKILFGASAYDEVNNRLGIGTETPASHLDISNIDPEIRLTDTGDSEYTRITRADTLKKASRYNRITKPGSVYTISNLVAQWKMNDNAANTTVAELGGLYNGVLNVNTNTKTIAGKIDTALDFNGSTDFVEVTDPNIGTANTFTICLWIYPTDTAYRNIISYGNDSANRGWTIKGSGGGNISLRNALGQTVTSVATAPVNQWTFVCAYIKTGWDDLNLFIDGVSQGWQHGGDTIAPNSTDDFRIGKVWDADQSGSTNYFLGRIDDVRYYNKVLSAEEISKIYNNGSGTDEQGLNAASTVEVDVWSSQDGVLAAEEGIQTFGEGGGRTVIDGLTLRFNIGGVEKANINASGNLGIGITTPTAVLHFKAGTATANTAPLKLTSGTLNTTAETGAIEFLTDAYYATITTGNARKTFAFLESPTFTGIVTAPTIVSTAIVRLKGYTVATLPVGTQGDTAFVTDATTPTYLGALVGGGAVVTPIFFDGVAWVSY